MSRRRWLIGGLAALGLVAGTAVAIPAASAAERDQLKVSIANVGGKATPPVGQILRAQHPDILIVSEAKAARAHLTTVAKNQGYRLRQYGSDEGAEAPNIALLIKNDVKLENRVLLKMSEPWWWSRGKRAPRRYPAVVLRADDRVWHVIGVHFPPGGPGGGSVVGDRNMPAWRESKRAVQEYAARNPNPPVVVAGDINATADNCRKHFPGFTVTKAGKVDHALVKKERGARVDAVVHHSPPKNQNMHGWATFKLSAASQ